MRGSCRDGDIIEALSKCRASLGASRTVVYQESSRPFGECEKRVVLAQDKDHQLAEPDLSDREVVARVQNGDRGVYQHLVERYQSRAFILAFQILKHQQDAEDVVQEAFVKAYLSISAFQGQSSFFTWFYRILVNMAIDFRRKINRQTKDTTSIDVESRDLLEQKITANHPDKSESPLESVLRREQAIRINQVLAEISPDHRAVIVLREVEGLRYEQIADVLGVSKGTVMSRLHYARKRLQELLGEALNYKEVVPSK